MCHILDNCLSRILQSPRVLKLGKRKSLYGHKNLEFLVPDLHWGIAKQEFGQGIIICACLVLIFLRVTGIECFGYNFQCDMKQLASSYETLGCFNHFEMLLDIQNVFKESSGGLSGLAEEILGAGLNKTRRNSNWEQRPLSQNQLEYAALDAAVFVHIFHHIRDQSQHATADGNDRIKWKSSIISHLDNAKITKKNVGNRTKC